MSVYKEIIVRNWLMVMKADESQDLQVEPARWRPRSTNGRVLSESKSLRTKMGDSVNSRLKASRLKTGRVIQFELQS